MGDTSDSNEKVLSDADESSQVILVNDFILQPWKR